MQASEQLRALLVDHGVEWIFGNPGTMELPFYDELSDGKPPRLALGLQEIVAVSMGLGYSAGTLGPAVAMLHTAAGLGNGLGALYNAARLRIPLVVLVGQVDDRHLLQEPILAGDVQTMARSVTKWSYEARSADDVAPAVARAFREALRPPRGPVCVSLPMNCLQGSALTGMGQRTAVHRSSPADDLQELATALCRASNPVIVCGAELVWAGAVNAVVELAEACGAGVVSEPLNSMADFPSRHPLYQGPLPASAQLIAKILGRYDVCVVLGAPVFRSMFYEEGSPLPEGLDVYQIDEGGDLIGQYWPISAGYVGELRASVDRLAHLCSEQIDRSSAEERNSQLATAAVDRRQRTLERAKRQPGLEKALIALGDAAGESYIVVDESGTQSWAVRRWFQRTSNNDFLACSAGGLGIGLGAAVGRSLAAPDREVLCIIGDGAIMYSVQALWSAAHLDARVTFLILKNGGYESLRQNYRLFDSKSIARGAFVGTELSPPDIDYVALAEAQGLDAVAAATPDELVHAVVGRRGKKPSVVVCDLSGN